MNYKELFHIALQLISSPARAWEEIRLEEDKQKVIVTFVYPMIGLCGLSVFIGVLLSNGWSGPQSFQYAMTRCCAVAVSLFGGYYLASYLIAEISERMFGLEIDRLQIQRFAGYAMVILFILQIVIGVLPDFKVVSLLLQFYTAFVVWEGSEKMLLIPEKERFRFTIFSTLVLLLCPTIIELIFNRLTMVLI
ncbi:MAG: YIP1 family protein [Mediterranea massiliensis]|nr:YIP1 family protein [Mediterranea massiliensis]